MQDRSKGRFLAKTSETSRVYGELSKLDSTVKEYAKQESITGIGQGYEQSGYILSGSVFLISESESGKKSIVEYYESGDMISMNALTRLGRENCYLSAKKASRIEFFKNRDLLRLALENSGSELGDELTLRAENKAMVHVVILEQHSLREKLMTYFYYLARLHDSNSFTLPLTVSDLADYICADRSAMSRELKRLNDDGIIISSRRKIQLLHR